jgi:hypothetical protein
MVVVRVWERGNSELVFSKYKISVGDDEKFWRLVAQQYEYKCPMHILL